MRYLAESVAGAQQSFGPRRSVVFRRFPLSCMTFRLITVWRKGFGFGLERTVNPRVVGSSPTPGAAASRADLALEREEISQGVASGESLRSIACRQGRAASTVSRGLTHNGGAGCGIGRNGQRGKGLLPEASSDPPSTPAAARV